MTYDLKRHFLLELQIWSSAKTIGWTRNDFLVYGAVVALEPSMTGDIQEVTGLVQQQVSKHIKNLVKFGMVETETVGRHKIYKLSEGGAEFAKMVAEMWTSVRT